MARGNLAKERVEKKIAEVFGGDYIGCIDKKLYLWADDGGEKVQICISMTCPKTPVGGENGELNFSKEPGNKIDFTNLSAAAAPNSFKPAEITEQERQNIAELMARLGL